VDIEVLEMSTWGSRHYPSTGSGRRNEIPYYSDLVSTSFKRFTKSAGFSSFIPSSSKACS